ncbi:endonuclease III [Carboxydothermus pertinax]|uniref:Endonuclease III n=1 Tax=Carboxydothermus pertinax TaxID=870242 RepID=A0A1L8CY70_9THEO|nr:endonuclease III [Carboxydothermus pertinax]
MVSNFAKPVENLSVTNAMKEWLNVTEKKVAKIVLELKKLFPEARTELNFSTIFQLVIAVVLSAQSTDRQVNKVTEKLFLLVKEPKDLLDLGEEELSRQIRSLGLYRSKAKNLIKLAKILETEYQGQVPDSFSDLIKLPGIGPKTAEVILGVGFNKPSFPVDTHVFRVARRLGLSKAKTPTGVSLDLKKIFPHRYWLDLHHRFIFFGRKICKAKKPNCAICPFMEFCHKEELNV